MKAEALHTFHGPPRRDEAPETEITRPARQRLLRSPLPSPAMLASEPGGKKSKISSGEDLTQLIIGSEGTLALATEVIVNLVPRLAHSATVLAPFGDLDHVMTAVPKIISSGLAPNIAIPWSDR